MRPHGSPTELEQRRFRALELLRQGLEPHVVAERLGVDRRSVRRWKRAYRRQGKAGLKAQPASGRPPKLTAGQRRSVVVWILQGAEACGFPTALWTCRRIAQLIRQRFHVVYHPDHIGRLLRSCGLTPQRPQLRAQERNDQRIRRWIQGEWSRAKKNFPASGPASSASTKRVF
jgi:transposase